MMNAAERVMIAAVQGLVSDQRTLAAGGTATMEGLLAGVPARWAGQLMVAIKNSGKRPNDVLRGSVLDVTLDGIGTVCRVPLIGMRSGAKYPQDRSLTQFIGFHATDSAGLACVLKDGRFRPQPWDLGGAGAHGIYCVAAIQYNDMSDADQAHLNKTKLTAAVSLGRNVAGLVLEIIFQGARKRLNQGGVEGEAAAVRPGRPVHMKTGKESRWVVHEDDAQIVAVWMTGEPPRQLDAMSLPPPWLQALR